MCAGEVKETEEAIAYDLITCGYAEAVEAAPPTGAAEEKGKKNENKSGKPVSRRRVPKGGA